MRILIHWPLPEPKRMEQGRDLSGVAQSRPPVPERTSAEFLLWARGCPVHATQQGLPPPVSLQRPPHTLG